MHFASEHRENTIWSLNVSEDRAHGTTAQNVTKIRPQHNCLTYSTDRQTVTQKPERLHFTTLSSCFAETIKNLFSLGPNEKHRLYVQAYNSSLFVQPRKALAAIPETRNFSCSVVRAPGTPQPICRALQP